MHDPIGQRVKIISGKHVGKEGTLRAIDDSGASVEVKRRSLWNLFHFSKEVIVSPAEIEIATTA